MGTTHRGPGWSADRPGFPRFEPQGPERVYLGMNLSLLFWVLYIVAIVFGLYTNRANFPAWAGGSLLNFVLIGILGWAVFGAAVHK